ncbi:MAG: isochorismatase family protein [Actinobacteria bacterium]|nr:isochorismatase family protein [Actinomycetota bacterium]
MENRLSNDSCGKLLAPDDCVLVIIDVQERLLPVMSGKEELLESVVTLVKFAKVIDMPVVVTEQEKLGPTVKEVADEIEDLAPISKIEFDACKRKGFLESLENVGRNTVIITGIESHVCVTQTVLSLLPDFTVHVVSDAVSSRTRENVGVALQRMRQSGAVISSTEMVIFELLEKAGTPEFKETLKLVK